MPKPTILVVDDDSACRSFLRDLFRLEGFSVITAESARQALRYLRHGECLPDLCVVDFIMPEMDGFQLLDRLRRIRWAGAIPVLLLTGSGLPVERQAGREGVAYFHKTRANAELIKQVKRLLPVRC